MTQINYFGGKEYLKEISKGKFKKVLLQLTKEHNCKISNINYILVNDPEILEINKTHLSHDYYTDIITFDLTEPNSSGIESEIYISYDTVQSNAIKYNTHFKNELLRVMFHGILHLIGYLDKSTTEKKQMRAMEEHCLNLYFETKS